MQIARDVFVIAHRGDHRVVHLRRMRGHETKALHTIDFRDGAEQRAEIAAGDWTAIGVDRLSKQLDLYTLARANFVEHVVERTRDFAAARRRHDAEGAVLIAAFDDRHLRFRRGWTIDGEIVVAAVFRKI